MTIRSELLRDGERIQKKRPPPWVPMAAVIIGAALWPLGARFTIDGIIWIGNWLLAFLTMPVRLPAPTYATYLVLAPLPIVCSFVEWRPMRWDWQHELRNPYGVVVWLFIAGIDLFTTYAGVRNPDPDATAAFREVAQSLALSGILTVALTFGPEWLLREGWRKLWR